MEITRVALDELHQDPANARSHDDTNLAAIEASLSRFGQAEPLVVQRSTNRIIGGNGRMTAMRKLGWAEAEVVLLDIDDLQATALGIALNRTAELAEWDEETLAKLLGQLRDDEALAGVGFDDDEIDQLIASLDDGAEPELDDPGAQVPPEEAVTRAGDLWLLGDHRLLCGDSTNACDVARLMDGETASLFASDPPYLVDYDSTHGDAEPVPEGGWDDFKGNESGVEFFRRYLELGLTHCREDVPVYQWHATRRQALVEAGWEGLDLLVHQTIVWEKSRGVLGRSHFMWRHEPCFYGWRRGSQPAKDRRPPNAMTTVWEIDQAGENDGIHPTQKPRDIFRMPIEWHTRRGEVCYEPFSGSGTQLIAAEELGRRCFAMEKSPAYVDAAIGRWEVATGKRAVLDGSGQTLAEASAERLS